MWSGRLAGLKKTLLRRTYTSFNRQRKCVHGPSAGVLNNRFYHADCKVGCFCYLWRVWWLSYVVVLAVSDRLHAESFTEISEEKQLDYPKCRVYFKLYVRKELSAATAALGSSKKVARSVGRVRTKSRCCLALLQSIYGHAGFGTKLFKDAPITPIFRPPYHTIELNYNVEVPGWEKSESDGVCKSRIGVEEVDLCQWVVYGDADACQPSRYNGYIDVWTSMAVGNQVEGGVDSTTAIREVLLDKWLLNSKSERIYAKTQGFVGERLRLLVHYLLLMR